MRKTVVVGLGNLLCRDEGIGVQVLERLEKEGGLPDEVGLIRGETGGLALLPALTEASAIVFVDAAEFEGQPGDIRVFRVDEIQKERNTPLSVHDVGLHDLISLLALENRSRPEIVVVGIKPKDLGVGLEISSEVEKAIPSAVMKIRAEVERLTPSGKKKGGK
jgi:hydrogenase maturation protease